MVSVSYAPGQKPGRELVPTPAILNYEIYWGSELATTLPVFLSGGMVHCPTETVCSVRSIRRLPCSVPWGKYCAGPEESVGNTVRKASACSFFKGSFIPCGERRE